MTSPREVIARAICAYRQDYVELAEVEAIAGALEAAGLVLVPREPTPAMVDALANTRGTDGQLLSDFLRAAYRAAVTAYEEDQP